MPTILCVHEVESVRVDVVHGWAADHARTIAFLAWQIYAVIEDEREDGA